jgi:hypothetical protein
LGNLRKECGPWTEDKADALDQIQNDRVVELRRLVQSSAFEDIASAVRIR